MLGLLLLSCNTGCISSRSAEMANAGIARDLTLHGLTALHHGKPEQAESLLHQASQTAPDDARIRQHLAQAMIQRGQLDQAEAQLKTAIELSKGDPSMYVDLGKLYLRKAQPKLALAQAELALEYNGQLADAWLLRGDCHRLLLDEYTALASYNMAANCDAGCAATQTQLAIAEVQSRMGEHMKALTALDLYKDQFAPDQIPLPALVLEGKSLVAMGHFSRAIETLTAALDHPSAGADVWLELSRAQQLYGDDSNARLTAMNALEKFPADEPLRAWSENLAQARSSQPPASASR